jgi:hypothetical protein
VITQRLVSKSTEKPKFIGRFDENDLQPSFEFRAGPRSVLNLRKRNAGVFFNSAVGATDPLVNIPDILCAVNLQLLLVYSFHFSGKNQEASDYQWGLLTITDALYSFIDLAAIRAGPYTRAFAIGLS